MRCGIFENGVLLKPVLGGVDNVAYFSTVNESLNQTETAIFTILLQFVLPGDHLYVTRIYL